MMKAAFGLGNPGSEYQHMRHNLGHMAVERYFKNSLKVNTLTRFHVETLKHADVLTCKRANLQTVLLVEPQFYMNQSGLAVKEVYEAFHLELDDCLIVYDDFAIEFGKLKAKAGGGAGGHHGMLSIIETLDTEEIPRLKIGIGHNQPLEDLTEYVLSEFSTEEQKQLDEILDRAAEAIDCFFEHGIEAVMNKFN